MLGTIDIDKINQVTKLIDDAIVGASTRRLIDSGEFVDLLLDIRLALLPLEVES